MKNRLKAKVMTNDDGGDLLLQGPGTGKAGTRREGFDLRVGGCPL
jgi:hypothetical protein